MMVSWWDLESHFSFLSHCRLGWQKSRSSLKYWVCVTEVKGQENGVYKLISNGTECPSGSTVELKYDASFRIVNSSHSKNNHRENSRLCTDNYPPVIQCLKRESRIPIFKLKSWATLFFYNSSNCVISHA